MSVENAHNASKTNHPFSHLHEYQFIRLTTFRKDGTAVPTTVWFAPGDGKLYVTTMNSAGKIKRIRNNGRVLLAPSDRTGQDLLGEEIEAHALLLDNAEFEQAHGAFVAKYSEQYTSIIARTPTPSEVQRVYFAIVPAQGAIDSDTK